MIAVNYNPLIKVRITQLYAEIRKALSYNGITANVYGS